jgi:DNA repair exonuclease SbcCD ATPase subunit
MVIKAQEGDTSSVSTPPPHHLATSSLPTKAETSAQATAEFLHRSHTSVKELCEKLQMPEVPPPIALRVGMRPNVEPRVSPLHWSNEALERVRAGQRALTEAAELQAGAASKLEDAAEVRGELLELAGELGIKTMVAAIIRTAQRAGEAAEGGMVQAALKRVSESREKTEVLLASVERLEGKYAHIAELIEAATADQNKALELASTTAAQYAAAAEDACGRCRSRMNKVGGWCVYIST